MAGGVLTPEILIGQGDQLFSKRSTLMMLWQDIAEQFYPERADFTVNREMGDNFAENLTTSYPLIVRRDLGNSFSTMLRPSATEWFHMGAQPDALDQPARAWLEGATKIMRRTMYDRKTQFTRATKEGDHDFASFGQCVLTVEPNRNHDNILYRCWHLRDVAWCENEEGVVDTVHRKWKPTAADLKALFGDKVHQKVNEMLARTVPDPYAEIDCRHIIIPAERYRDPRFDPAKTPYVSIHIDVTNKHIMRAVGMVSMMYVIPRWQTVSGSQYAYSPATITALPDARLLQAMTYVLLQAGEKAVDPPMVAVQEAIRSDIALYAGGITWVDHAYDEKTGEVLRQLPIDKAGIPLGIDMQRDARAMLMEIFYLNKLTLPAPGPEMTAYEVGQRIQEYVRQATPIFEPMEMEYNGALCEATFQLMLRSGGFNALGQIPPSLMGQDPGWRFESPLHEAIEKQKGQRFIEAGQLLAQAVSMDRNAGAQLDVGIALKEALIGIGTPAAWMRPEDVVEKMVAAADEAANAAQQLQLLQAGADAAATLTQVQPPPGGATAGGLPLAA